MSASLVARRCGRGAVLLEIVLALGLFVATSMTLLGVVSGAIDSLSRSRERLIGSDHARNGLAMIEAGLARPEALNGPVAPWSAGDDVSSDPLGSVQDEDFPPDASAGGFSLGPGEGNSIGQATGWALQIETEPARVPGLTLVAVRAYRVSEAGDEIPGGASITLRQIVSLSGDDGPSPLEPDAGLVEPSAGSSGFRRGGGEP